MNKKVIIPTVVAIITLVTLIIGATYAYFAVSILNTVNSSVNADVEETGTVTLSGGATLSKVITASDMSISKASSKYDLGSANIASATLTGGSNGVTYACEFTLDVVNNSDMKTNGGTDGGINISVADKVSIIGSNGEEFTKGDNLSPDEINSGNYKVYFQMGVGDFSLPKETNIITISGSINNDENDDTQKERLAGKSILLKYDITDFKCDVDIDVPKIEKFYIENEEQKYLTKKETQLYLSWLDEDVKYYCITDVQNNDDCIWVETIGNSILIDYTFENDGENILYSYIKDDVGKISGVVSDKIIVDTVFPTDNSISINSGETYTTSTSVALTLASTGAKEMCISNTTSCSSWETYSTSKSWTLNNSTNGTKTVYVWYRDVAGNVTDYTTDTIILDMELPTVTASAVNNGTASPKISITSNEAGTYCVNTSSTRTNVSNCVASGSITANTTIQTSALTTSNTYYVHVQDVAGNIGISSTVSITKGNAIGTYLINTKTSGFNSTMEGGLYRYQGTSANNYICFGTSDKNTCLGNTDAYMYRIIGVNSSGQAKLIKNEALNTTMKWHSVSNVDAPWPESDLFKAINGNSFLQNTTYVPSGWEDKIADTSWKYGDNANVDLTAQEIYNIENGWSKTVNAKIGLMYVHDFVYATQSGGLNCYSSATLYNNCSKTWLHMKNSDSKAPADSEWLMTRYGKIDALYFSYWIASNGGIAHLYMVISSRSVRPVFYLTSSVQFKTGTGTSTDPFIIS